MIQFFVTLCLLLPCTISFTQVIGGGASVPNSPVNSYVGLNQFERAILDRNGDVYVLVTPSNPNQPRDAGVGLYRFRKVENYASEVLGVSNSDKIQNYEGLAVDKFGHIKFFRNQGDQNASSILNTTQTYPGQSGFRFEARIYDDTPGVDCAEHRKRRVSPPGWVYAIAQNGDEGWFKYYDYVQDVDMASVTSIEASKLIKGYRYTGTTFSFPAGTVILPPEENTKKLVNINTHHGGFWRGDCTRSAYGVEADSNKLHPPIEGFAVRNIGANNRVVRYIDVQKFSNRLFLDEYITQQDNQLLVDAANGVYDSISKSVSTSYAFEQGLDYNIGTLDPNIDGMMRDAVKPLSTNVSFSPSLKVHNACGDQCGQFPQDGVVPPVSINKGRAKFSSGGQNQKEQRSYMLDTRTVKSGSSVELETWVVELSFDRVANEYRKSDIIRWNRTGLTPGETENPNEGRLIRKNNPLTSVLEPMRVVIYDFNKAPYARSVQTSKRDLGNGVVESKDYVYVSNLPPSHFNVSSNFWGTGGVVWWAEPDGNNLKLNFEQVNHRFGKLLMNGQVKAANATPLLALGADGDNFVYLLHLGKGTENQGGGLETPAEMERLLSPITPGTIDRLCQLDRLPLPCPSFPMTAVRTGPTDLRLRVKQRAGAMLEKIAPLPGSVPSKVGVVPLGDTGGFCESVIVFLDNGDGVIDSFDAPGNYLSPWKCDEPSFTFSEIQNRYNFEMSVINVANPPATAGRFNLDIVAQETGSSLKGGVKEFSEDLSYTFYMENPPIFNGVIAQLGLASEAELAAFGDVNMVSNYEIVGTDLARQKYGNRVNDYYDDDDRLGTLLPSFIYKENHAISKYLNPKIGPDVGSDSVQNLRYRWRVIARTPPHSLKTYLKNAGKPFGCQPLLANGSGQNLPNVKNLQASGFLDSNANEVPYDMTGVLEDTCWQDLKDSAGVEKSKKPKELRLTFEDPGVYDVYLYFAGLRFNADGKTFLDSASSIAGEVVVTWYAMEVQVGAQKPQADDSIKNVVIANNYLEGDVSTRSGMLSGSSFIDSQLAGSGDDLTNSHGRIPVMAVGNHSRSAGNVVVTYQDQYTPIVAEADIQFFRLQDLKYAERALSGSKTQTKFFGVGAWDYSYPGGGQINVNGMKFMPLNKISTHPSNWSTSVSNTTSPPPVIVTADRNNPTNEERRGYDASGDYETGRGYNNNGQLISIPASLNLDQLVDAKFQAAHQGTLASDDAFPATYGGKGFVQNLIEHPEAFYTWWEIKYAWFMRYTRPDGTVHKKIVKTGNLAEIFLMNLMAVHGSSGWKNLIKNLAPDELKSSGNSVSANSSLMKYVDQNLRTIRVRVPLFSQGAILAGTGSAEMNAGLLGTYSSGDSFEGLFTKIHPLKFPIPSEPTVLEIGFQLFFPKMGWEGRDENPKGSGKFRYYDAVYWGEKSDAAGKHQIADYLPISYKFDAESESFSTWPRFAKQRTLENFNLQVDEGISNRLGLGLAPLKNNHVDGGLKAGVGYRSPGGQLDDFVDIVVLDMKAPKLIANKGAALKASTGGRVNDDIVLSVTDNNPYALWDSYESIGDSTKYKRSPALVHFAYEIGYDPKARLGTGLKTSGTNGQERAYGFHLSYTTLNAGQSQLDANDLPSYRVSMAGLGTPSAETEPGFTYKPFDIASNSINFSYPYLKADSFPSDGTFVERLEPGGINERADKEDAWARMMNPDVRFYMPENNYINPGSVRTKDPIVKTDLNSWMISLIPDVNGEVPFNQLKPNHPDGVKVEFYSENDGKYSRLNDACFGSATPLDADPLNCEIESQWLVKKENLVAPYFISTEGAYHVYAKARDTRFTRNMTRPALQGNWPDFDFNGDWELRMGAENYGEDGDMGARSGNGIQDMVSHVYDNPLQQKATKVSTITVKDNDPPNLRVTLVEFKYNKRVEYTIMGAQGLDPTKAEDSDKLHFFRTEDKRSSDNDIFNSIGFYKELEEKNFKTGQVSTFAVNKIVSSSQHKDQAFFIPEDVRFMVKVEASDNKDLDEIEITVGHDASGASVYTPEQTDVQFIRRDEGKHLFPERTSAAGSFYQQAKILTQYHMYPNANFYDVLKISVKDSVGNQRILKIPIVVVKQGVHFRQLGDQTKVK